ncbi:Wall-associated receptor kinase 2 [Vitis vinifera]|uniref:Wall-associated receptor kinase 2 n=1 Tax=Vitis vinifera TaxID=29760 RepID=A0A438DQP2_VITVI|nr:Wall-associated receptor kinase 2 [Vitis vinifera]
MSLIIGLMFVAATAAAQEAKPDCQESCGNISIPYPFGTSPECYISEEFLITCNTTNYSPPQAFLTTSNIQVLEILLQGQLRVSGWVGYDCYNSSNHNSWLELSKFTISTTQNKLTAVGCDTIALVTGYRGQNYTTGCVSLCDSVDDVINGSCAGIGCCQTFIPRGARSYDIELASINKYQQVLDFNPCSYAFVAEDGVFNFSSLDLLDLRGRQKFPLVLDWLSETKIARKQKWTQQITHARRTHNVMTPSVAQAMAAVALTATKAILTSAVKGYEGDGRKNGTGCTLVASQSQRFPLIIILGTSITLLVILLTSSWIYLGLRERKLIKRKEKFFQKNGGIMLQQLLSKYEGCTETTKIFTAKGLQKATDNYHESRILGQGGQGTVYKGILPDNRVVAIKKSKVTDQSQVEQFVNEVHILSQINHRNVVKLLGCCLETEVPLLVYEFVTNGTLSSHIHDTKCTSSLSWETCLRIASETAGALSYLHSSASTPIIHRDVKSTNVLLDDNFTAKVSDFGASRLVPLDQTQVATLVQGTFGYLDPEYFHSGQLTDKSDVYSFGVLLAELLTGKKVICFDRPEKERHLVRLFHSAVKEDRLLEVLDNKVLNEEHIQYFMEVAMLAKRCLKVKGQERPTMKEVAMELERVLKLIEKHPWVQGHDWNLEETEALMNESLKAAYGCDSSNTTGYDSLKSEVKLNIDSGR